MAKGNEEQSDYSPEGDVAQLEELVGAEKIDRSALPEDERSPFISDTLAEAHEVHYDSNYLKNSSKVYAGSKESRFTQSEGDYYKYESRPLWQAGLFGTLAVALFLGQWFMPEINDALGDSFGWSKGGTLGTIRFCMMFVGAYCAFMAWPKYKPKGISDEEAATRQKNKDDFRRKFRR